MIRTVLMAFVPGGTFVQAAVVVGTALLKFLTSTIGLVMIAAVLAYGTGWHYRGKKCDEAALRASLAATQADLTAANDAANMAQAQSAQMALVAQANQGKVDALSKELKSRQGRDCGLSSGDVSRLRSIQ